ncbi:MAG TPA: hypothetical protein VFA48_02685 [Gammaproteobacteria bacterium]|nr:hypothetical protein [Gammaproteobacteria bacterium]
MKTSTLRYRFLLSLVALMLAMPALAATPPAVQKALKAAINGPQRTPAYAKRDRYRHPLQTLEFFGIRPDMRVVEVLPGGGWYTEILAPFLHDHGHLIEATPPTTSPNPFFRKMAKKYKAKLAADPSVYGHVKLQAFSPPAYMPLGAPDSADMILTFRNMHDLIYANVHGQVTALIMQRFFRSAYRALKPGGILGVVGHRANPDASVAKSHKLGRLPQHFVIQQAEQAGFKLAGTSGINANPKDPRDMPIWYLPPTLERGKTDRAHYKAIGEGDNMTLKFVKPGE